MAETTTPFTPYWKPLGRTEGPNSWAFFVVAQVAGRHRPLAVISSVGPVPGPEESLQGSPLVAVCDRILTIFSDPANHTAYRGELALAADYYERRDSLGHRLEPIELPMLNRKQYRPHREWDSSSVPEFPCVSASLLQGVTFAPRLGYGGPARPEPLDTVYRDTDIEWGMAIFDITNLTEVRYGIVGFAVGMAKFISKPRDAFWFQGASFQPEEGPLRVRDDVRPRRAMTVAEYMNKFDYHNQDCWRPSPEHEDIMKRLATIPLVNDEAMVVVWPSTKDDTQLKAVTEATQTSTSQQELISGLLQETLRVDDFDLSKLDELRHILGFEATIREHLRHHSDNMSARVVGHLIRLACTRGSHLGMELMDNLTAEMLSVALEEKSDCTTPVTSVSLCIDSFRGPPAQLVAVLSRAACLKEVYFLQHHTRKSTGLSVPLLAELATQPDVLSRVKVVFADAYSAALRKQCWLPPTNKLPLSKVFPVHQILVRHHQRSGRKLEFEYDCINVRDGLLKAEHFAAGFLLWLSTLEPPSWMPSLMGMPFCSFSSAPASLDTDPRSAAELGHMLSENMAVYDNPSGDFHIGSPRVRDIENDGWTVLVTQEVNSETQSSDFDALHIRYAFVRARQPFVYRVDDPPPFPPGAPDLEVVGLKEFLNATAPEVDPAVIDLRLRDTEEKIVAMYSDQLFPPWPVVVQPLSVLSHKDAAEALVDFLNNAHARNK